MCCNSHNNSNLGRDIQYNNNRISADCPEPYAQVCISCPPPCPIPLCPCPVKPLQLPCPYNQGFNNGQPNGSPNDDHIEKIRSAPNSRYDNFYNNYNIDWHSDGTVSQPNNNNGQNICNPPRAYGTTLDGQSPCCENYMSQQQINASSEMAGCPTGFKPCKFKLQPPPSCSPCGCWTAQIQSCPPKLKKKELDLANEPCTRPCCMHWEDEGGPCLYDDPCRAHCFNHPPGMKPSGRFP